MRKIVDTHHNVAATIADTLSESQKQELRHATGDSQPQHGNQDNSHGSSKNGMDHLADRVQNLDFIQHIKANPLQSVGLALLGSVLIHFVFASKR